MTIRNNSGWTMEDNNYLLSNHEVLTDDVIADQLGRTLPAIRNRVKLMREKGEIAAVVVPGWTKEMDEYLKANFESKTVRVLMRELDMSKYRIQGRMKELGLSKMAALSERTAVANRISAMKPDKLLKLRQIKTIKGIKGKQYIVLKKVSQSSVEMKGYFKGRLIHETDRCITLKNDRTQVKESFLKTDLLTGEYKFKGEL